MATEFHYVSINQGIIIMNSTLKNTTFSLTSSLLMTIGISLPTQAHLNMNFHGHQNANFKVDSGSPTTTTPTIQLQSDAEQPLVLPNVDRQGYWLFSDNATFVATDSNTNGLFSLFDFTTLPGGPLPHLHTREDEFVYVLDGEITYQLGDDTFTATPGSFISKPKDVLHSFINAGDKPVRHLEFVVPSGIEGLFSSLGQPGTPDNPPPPQPPTTDLLEGGFQLLNDFGVIAPDSLMFSPAQYGITQEGEPEVTILRPGEATGEITATITLSDGTEIQVTFEDGERIKTIPIPLSAIGDNQTIELTITDTIALLQNKAILTIGDNNTYSLIDGYDPDHFRLLSPEPQLESFWLAGDNYDLIAGSDDTNGLLSLFNVSVSESSEADQLFNAPTDLAFYILEGDVTFGLGNQSFTATPDTFVYVPEGNSYSLSNSGDTSAQTLLFNTTNPGGLENFIASVGTPQDITSVPEPLSVYGFLLVMTSSLACLRKRQ